MPSAVEQMKKTLDTKKSNDKKPSTPTKQVAKKTATPVVKQKTKSPTFKEGDVANILRKIPGVKVVTTTTKATKSPHDRFSEIAEKAIERDLNEPGVSTTPPWEEAPKPAPVLQEKKPEPKPAPVAVPQVQAQTHAPASTPTKRSPPAYSGGVLGIPGSGFRPVGTTVKR